jgi:hypothetical protein
MKYCIVQYRVVQCRVEQCYRVLCNEVLCSVVWCREMNGRAVKCSGMWYSVVHRTIVSYRIL